MPGSNKHTVVAILRHNINLAGDVGLARREFAALTQNPDVGELATWADVEKTPFLTLPGPIQKRIREGVRATPPVAFTADVSASAVRALVKRSAFLQDVIVRASDPDVDFGLPEALVHRHGPWLYGMIPVNALCEYVSQLLDCPGQTLPKRLDLLLEYLLRGEAGAADKTLRSAFLTKKTTLSLTHDLHIYKGKFFPRMVRGLLNVFGGASRNAFVIDPFSGSGTTLLESSSLGYEALGVDVDPVSALISDCKVKPFTVGRAATRSLLSAVAEELSRSVCEVPAFGERRPQQQPSHLSDELRGKLARRDLKDNTSYLSEIEHDLQILYSVREKFKQTEPGILEVLLSDAVTKKIRYRFVGIGNGRYTIEVVNQRITDRLSKKVASALALCDAFEWLESRCELELGESSAIRASATSFQTPNRQRADICLTSPPYLPASSGREHYAAARALALSLTGLDEVWQSEKFSFIGSVDPKSESVPDLNVLTPAGQSLLNYLLSDTDRTDTQRDPMRFERKAIPTWHYLIDIEKFLIELRGKIEDGGVCLLVVASQHIFYSHRRHQEAKQTGSGTNSIEYVALGNELYGQIAERVGWDFVEEIRLELAKSASSMARPRSSDEYHESVLVLRPRI